MYLCTAFVIDQWCNGSTAVFGTACLGSNPGWSTNKSTHFFMNVVSFFRVFWGETYVSPFFLDNLK